jgi:hypothetical protein
MSVITEVIISLEESTPSATTARLPEMSPAVIFKADSAAFPEIPTQEAFLISCSLEAILCYEPLIIHVPDLEKHLFIKNFNLPSLQFNETVLFKFGQKPDH